MPISPTLPTDGQSDWDVPLNAALTEIVDGVNDNETAIAGKLDASAAPELIRDTMGAALVAGANVTITPNDGSDTITISASGGGGGGAVDSVNGATGTVVLDQDDVLDGSTYKQYSATEKTKLAGIEAAANATPAASTTVAGAVELATTAEATTGTDTVRAVTPEGLKTVADTKAALSHTHAASDINSGTVATARLGSGTANSTTFLRGDQTWGTPAGSGGATGASVYLNAATLTAASGARVVILDTVEIVDTGFSYNTTTGEMTLTNAGWYSVFGHVRFSTTASAFNFASITVGGSPVILGQNLTATTAEVAVAGVDYFAAGTVLKLEVTTGSSVSVQGGNRYRSCLRVVRHP